MSVGIALWLALISGIVGSPRDATIHEAQQKALSEDIQTTLELDEITTPTKEPRLTFGFAKVLLWGLAICGFALMIFYVVNEWIDRSQDRVSHVVDAEIAADSLERVVSRPLGDAQTLAAEGKFSQAIHVLLLRTIEELRITYPRQLAHSLTSRELVKALPLKDNVRTQFANLVNAVELSHFGLETPTLTDYEYCVSHFHGFAKAYRTNH